MFRVPYAMRQLQQEILQIAPKAIFETDDLDGFGVYRTLRWDSKTSAKIAGAIGVVASRDPRIERPIANGVVFVATTIADSVEPLSLADVQAILKPTPQPKKRARKAATKPKAAK